MILRHYNDSVVDQENGENKYAFKHTSKDKKWMTEGPKDVLYTHHGGINTRKYSQFCITYNPRNETLTGRSNRVRKCKRQKDSANFPVFFR